MSFFSRTDTPPKFGARAALMFFIFFVLFYFIVDLAVDYSFSFVWEAGVFAIESEKLVSSREVLLNAVKLLCSTLGLFLVLLATLKSFFPERTLPEILKNMGFVPCTFKINIGAFLLALFYMFVFINLLYNPEISDFGENQKEYKADSFATLSIFIFLVICKISVVPLVEELFFRGVLYKGFLSSFGKITAGFLVTLLFAFSHVGMLEMGYGIITANLFIISIALLLLRVYTNSLMPAIFFHSGINLMASSGVLVLLN